MQLSNQYAIILTIKLELKKIKHENLERRNLGNVERNIWRKSVINSFPLLRAKNNNASKDLEVNADSARPHRRDLRDPALI